ncbi:hypothetical protein HanIR_Chr05g0224611 [Helianthus annuus]|nr:hypothetical protein HanIR_Chr05g0224611 [Helianthus annuus]
MLETPVIGVNGALGTVEVMSPYLKCENNCSQFQVVHSVVPFVNLKLARCVGNNLVTLHQYATKPLDGSVAVNRKIICAFRQGEDRRATKSIFQVLKCGLLCITPTIGNTLLSQ